MLWPTFGNHDAISSNSSTESGPYYDAFTLPDDAQAGGVASSTEAYYSFDWGNVHFICLDSSEGDRTPPSPMITWLQNDLAGQPTTDWIVAYWHHPPYTKGGHNSDTETELVQMRENLLPILEAGGVDLVLTGHSHSYERSFLIDGHYGTSAPGAPRRTRSTAATGAPPRAATAPTSSRPAGRTPHEGAVYVVAGSSGKITGGALDHPAMFTSIGGVLGSVVLEVDGDRMDLTFVTSDGRDEATGSPSRRAWSPRRRRPPRRRGRPHRRRRPHRPGPYADLHANGNQDANGNHYADADQHSDRNQHPDDYAIANATPTATPTTGRNRNGNRDGDGDAHRYRDYNCNAHCNGDATATATSAPPRPARRRLRRHPPRPPRRRRRFNRAPSTSTATARQLR